MPNGSIMCYLAVLSVKSGYSLSNEGILWLCVARWGLIKKGEKRRKKARKKMQDARKNVQNFEYKL